MRGRQYVSVCICPTNENHPATWWTHNTQTHTHTAHFRATSARAANSHMSTLGGGRFCARGAADVMTKRALAGRLGGGPGDSQQYRTRGSRAGVAI